MQSRRITLWFIGLALLTPPPFGAAHARAEHTGTAGAVPVLVELFTAEGCASCPPADALLEKMIDAQPADGARIVALGLHVDYWNQSGWKDRFASAAFTKRQQVYAARTGSDTVYTPQMVVDGDAAFVGSDVVAARRAIEHAMTLPHGAVRLTQDPSSRDKGKIAVSIEVTGLPPVDSHDPADILVAVTEDGLRTEVKRGENQGRTLTHAAVVRELQTVGDVTSAGRSARATFEIASEWRRENLKIVCFVQHRQSRRVIATAVVPVETER